MKTPASNTVFTCTKETYFYFLSTLPLNNRFLCRVDMSYVMSYSDASSYLTQLNLKLIQGVSITKIKSQETEYYITLQSKNSQISHLLHPYPGCLSACKHTDSIHSLHFTYIVSDGYRLVVSLMSLLSHWV